MVSCSFAYHLSNSGLPDVERINQFPFYTTGKALRQIEEHTGDTRAQDAALPILTALQALDFLLQGNLLPLTTSKVRAETLRSEVDSLMQRHFFTGPEGDRRFRVPDETVVISSWEWNVLRTALSNFEAVFSEEMREATTYYVPRRGIFFTPSLIDAADETFPSAIRGYIPPKTIDDWRAAGRCLAFNLLTASGFHAARAVEGTLESYYQLFAGKPGATLRSWDDYIKSLREIAAKENSPSPSQKTLSELDQMRTFDRNPIMHPRIVLSESDARILFGSSESLIIAMAQEIYAVKSAGGVQAGLALIESAGASA